MLAGRGGDVATTPVLNEATDEVELVAVARSAYRRSIWVSAVLAAVFYSLLTSGTRVACGLGARPECLTVSVSPSALVLVAIAAIAIATVRYARLAAGTVEGVKYVHKMGTRAMIAVVAIAALVTGLLFWTFDLQHALAVGEYISPWPLSFNFEVSHQG